MYRLQLFAEADADQPIDARFLSDGRLSIGRDTTVDWSICDPECAISRVHCHIQADADGLVLTTIGANGVFDEEAGHRFEDGVGTRLTIPCTLRLGNFRLAIAVAPQTTAQGGADQTMISAVPFGASIEVPTQWSDAVETSENPTESLLEAFCQGAGFDSSALSAEDPVVIMRRAGAVYRQMVLGVSDLMQERDRARARLQLNRTRIGAAGNNYFKWAPSQRLAVDLLMSDKATFLSGPDAVRLSFRDIKRHLIATVAGLRGSLQQAVDAFSPAVLADAAAGRPGLLKSRAALQVEEIERRHSDMRRELEDSLPGMLESAFVQCYEQADDAAGRTGQ